MKHQRFASGLSDWTLSVFSNTKNEKIVFGSFSTKGKPYRSLFLQVEIIHFSSKPPFDPERSFA